jgi:hypothetical protein
VNESVVPGSQDMTDGKDITRDILRAKGLSGLYLLFGTFFLGGFLFILNFLDSGLGLGCSNFGHFYGKSVINTMINLYLIYLFLYAF